MYMSSHPYTIMCRRRSGSSQPRRWVNPPSVVAADIEARYRMDLEKHTGTPKLQAGWTFRSAWFKCVFSSSITIYPVITCNYSISWYAIIMVHSSLPTTWKLLFPGRRGWGPRVCGWDYLHLPLLRPFRPGHTCMNYSQKIPSVGITICTQLAYLEKYQSQSSQESHPNEGGLKQPPETTGSLQLDSWSPDTWGRNYATLRTAFRALDRSRSPHAGWMGGHRDHIYYM